MGPIPGSLKSPVPNTMTKEQLRNNTCREAWEAVRLAVCIFSKSPREPLKYTNASLGPIVCVGYHFAQHGLYRVRVFLAFVCTRFFYMSGKCVHVLRNQLLYHVLSQFRSNNYIELRVTPLL